MAEAFKDYYAILGVDSKATEQEIRIAYRKAARKYHPDLHTKGEKAAAEEKFKEVNEAYTALGNAEKRAQYDHFADDIKNGRVRQPPPDRGTYSQYTGTSGDTGGYTRDTPDGTGAGADSFSDFFESIFGRSGFNTPQGGSGRRTDAKGQDLESELSLTMEEAYRGGGKTVQFSLRSTCETCGGTGVLEQGICPECHGTASKTTLKSLDVKIPPFVREGSKIRLKGQGGAGSGSGRQGDLLLTVRILPNARFTLTGNNMETAVRISPEQAVLGCQISVPTMEGDTTVTVPPMIHSGRKLRLRSKGWKDRDGVRGDLYISVTIDIPRSLSAGQLELYKRLAGLGKEA
jgi:DnaJ-class molecular chaperone